MRIQFILVILVLVALVTAKKGMKNTKKNKGCKYIKGLWGECDESTNEMKRILTLKEAKDGCEPAKEQTRPCKKKQNKKCKYDKGEWGECGAVTKDMVSRTNTLRSGEHGCEQTQIQTLSCEKFLLIQQRKAAKEKWKTEKKLLKATRQKLKDLEKDGCVLEDEVTECNHGNHSDTETQKATMTFMLKAGDTNLCKIDPVEISCEMAEDIKKKLKQKMERKQKKKERKKERKQKKRKNKGKMKKRKKDKKRKNKDRRGSKKDKCKYEIGPWSECDVTTDTMKMTMTLQPGTTASCPPTKTLSKKCKKPCKYKTGKWGPCVNGITKRMDQLKKNSQDICEPVRTLTKKCKGRKSMKKKNGGCIYDKGSWGSCDPVSNKRAKKKLLKSGDPKSCSREKIVYRSCSRSNGEDRCFFGSWGDWSDCQNGVQKQQRKVLQGGVNCEKKAVKTQPCS